MRDRRQRATSSTDDGQKKKERSRSLSLYVEDTFRDLRLSCRTLARNPGFTAVVIVTLALGIGLNTAVFTLFDVVSLRPMAVPDPHQIVDVYSGSREYSCCNPFSFPDYLYFRETNQAFSGLIAYSGLSVHLNADGFTERVMGELVSANYTKILGVEPMVGRGFVADEDRVPGRYPMAMISARLWRKWFNSSQDIVGKTVRVNGHAFTLVGVLPDHFKGLLPRQADVWVPLMMQPQVQTVGKLDSRLHAWLYLVGRLKPEITLDIAHSNLAVLVSKLELEEPKWKDRIVSLVPRHRAGLNPYSQSAFQSYWILLAAVSGSLLLIACANVANLLLSRARGRNREMAIQLAAGASRERLIRYLLTETAVLFLAAAAAGTLMANWCVGLTPYIPLLPFKLSTDQLGLGLLDGRMLLCALVLSLMTAIIFGLIPARQSGRIDLFPELKATDAYVRVRGGRWRDYLVTSQVAVSFVLLVVAGLFIRSVANQTALDPGFESENVGTLSVDLDTQGYDRKKGAFFLRQLLKRAEEAPGVESATVARFVPATSSMQYTYTYRETRAQAVSTEVNSVGPRYFKTLRIPLLRGRDFRWTDDPGSPPVAIINQTLAERFWPNADPVGEQIFTPSGNREVIGVATEIQYHEPGEIPPPYLYVPMLQTYTGEFTLMVGTQRGTASATMASMQEIVQGLDPDLPKFGPPSLSAVLAETIERKRSFNLLLIAFSTLALILTSVGLYGVLSYFVVQRTREMAVRMAMGAKRIHTVRVVLKRATVMVAIGLSIGIGVAFGLTTLIGHNLYEVAPSDPMTFLVAALVVVVASLLACWVPAHRITRLEPMEALRHE